MIESDSFNDRLKGLLSSKPKAIAIALSGGADSLALTLLLKDWCDTHHITLTALHVHHGLRDEATEEAEQIQAWMTEHHIACHILTVEENLRDAPNIQNAARKARYQLMTQWCTSHNVSTLCLGHHADDQAETFLMRLARGSGVDGLAAMHPITSRDGITLLRPLLDIPKSELISYLENRGQPWIEDASNQSTDYTRNRIRQLTPILAEEQITASRITDVTHHLARTSDCLQQLTHAWIESENCFHEAYAIIPTEAFATLHEELALRVARQLLLEISASPQAIRFEHLQPLTGDMQTGTCPKRTLHGCVIAPHQSGILIYREAVKLAAPITVSEQPAIWDHRFSATSATNNLQLGALGAHGLAQLRTQKAELPTLPAALLHTCPALFHLEDVIAVPHIDYVAQTCDDYPCDIRYVPKDKRTSMIN